MRFGLCLLFRVAGLEQMDPFICMYDMGTLDSLKQISLYNLDCAILNKSKNKNMYRW